jgi:hypothetical protein
MPTKGKSKYLHFENARRLVRDEQLRSVSIFKRWHRHNKPELIPNRPDIIYKKKGWVSWNDFLGNENEFKHFGKKICVSYEKGRQYARSLGLSTLQEWFDHARSGALPENIPRRPDYFYKEWFTWSDWLGKDVRKLAEEAVQNIPILFVLKVGSTPFNVFKVDVTYGGKAALEDVERQGARVFAAFYYNKNLDWRQILARFGTHFWKGDANDYAFSNVNGFLFEMQALLDVVE